jgi:hypothetical protein
MRPSARTLAYIRRRSEESMHSVVRVVRLDASAMDEDTGMVFSKLDTTHNGYHGKARIWTVANGGTVVVGDEEIQTAQTNISLPANAAPVPKIDDYVVVEEHDDDQVLVGRYYRVNEIDGGGLMRPTRRLTVEAVTDTRWTR